MRIDLSKSTLSEIGPKEYLSRKDVEELILPIQVERIGNWAFAHMKNLKRIVFPRKQLMLGKEILKGCDRLKQVCIESEAADDASYLLAAAVVDMGEQGFLVPEQVGSAEWTEHFDHTLQDFIYSQDETGFQPMWFGGEEDYDDNDTNVELYRRKRQKEKVKLVILRLCHNTFLTPKTRNVYYEFLQSLLVKNVQGDKADEFANELWQMIGADYGQDGEVITCLLDAGCITIQNREIVMEALQEIAPEGKALLLSYFAGRNQGQNFYEELEL